MSPARAPFTSERDEASIEIRPTSKGGRAVVRTFNKMVNQRGEVVVTYNPLRLMAGRPK